MLYNFESSEIYFSKIYIKITYLIIETEWYDECLNIIVIG